jgi:hypothetical protein
MINKISKEGLQALNAPLPQATQELRNIKTGQDSRQKTDGDVYLKNKE